MTHISVGVANRSGTVEEQPLDLLHAGHAALNEVRSSISIQLMCSFSQHNYESNLQFVASSTYGRNVLLSI